MHGWSGLSGLTILFSQSGKTPAFALCIGGTSCLQQEGTGYPCGAGCWLWAATRRELPGLCGIKKLSGLEKPTFWALACQAVSRQSPKSWPGSLGDPMTFPKGVSWERPSGAYPCPPNFSLHGGWTDWLFQGWKPRESVPSPAGTRGAFFFATH
jgi:hypothetical protein